VTVGNSLDRIIATAGKRMTAEQAPERKAKSAHNTVLPHSFNRIL